MNKKTLLALFPLYLWLVSFSFVILIQLKKDISLNFSGYNLSETTLISLWFIGNFYLFYTFLVPEYLDKGRTKLFVALSLVFLLISPLLVDLLLKLNKILFSVPVSNRITIRGFAGGVFGSFITGVTLPCLNRKL